MPLLRWCSAGNRKQGIRVSLNPVKVVWAKLPDQLPPDLFSYGLTLLDDGEKGGLSRSP